ncbi:MAG: anti-sigma factor, partial [Sphingomonas sp.]
MTSRPIGEDDLHAYVDGVLGGHRRAEVEAVLNAQPELRARVARDIEARDALRAALAGMADEPV